MTKAKTIKSLAETLQIVSFGASLPSISKKKKTTQFCCFAFENMLKKNIKPAIQWNGILLDAGLVAVSLSVL